MTYDICQDGFESDSTLYPDTDCEDIYGGRVSSAFGGCHGEEEDGHLDYVTRTIGDIENNNNKQHPHKCDLSNDGDIKLTLGHHAQVLLAVPPVRP